MALVAKLNTIEALFRKAERERFRALNQSVPLHLADHFYNFCVTAHSFRDYLKVRLALPNGTDRILQHRWDSAPLLVAVKDIANSAKHFQLYKTPRTRRVRHARTSGVKIIFTDDGEIEGIRVPQVPTIYVVLENGERRDLESFLDAVLKYWQSELSAHGIRMRRQSHRNLRGKMSNDSIG